MVEPAPEPTRGDDLPIDVDLIKVLAADTRRDILRLLGTRRMTLTELSAAMQLKKATVLEHLKRLTDASLIRRHDQDERLWIYYELTPRGRRLVQPGRTRFYLIMGAAAAAVLIAGAAFVAAGAFLQADEVAPPAFASGHTPGVSTQTYWKGLDDGILFDAAPMETTVTLWDAGGARYVMESTTLDAAFLDALPTGTYEARAEDSVLGVVDVRAPRFVVHPLVVAEGGIVEATLLDGPSSGAWEVQIGQAQTIELRNGTARFAPAAPPGPVDVRLGRLAPVSVFVEADFHISMDVGDDGGTTLSLRDRDGVPIRDARIAIDHVEMGRTNESGQLAFVGPTSGSHTLRIDAGEDRTQERRLEYFGGVPREAPFAPLLEALDASPQGEGALLLASATAGRAGAFTLSAHVDGTLVAAGASALGAEARQVELFAPLPPGMHDVMLRLDAPARTAMVVSGAPRFEPMPPAGSASAPASAMDRVDTHSEPTGTAWIRVHTLALQPTELSASAKPAARVPAAPLALVLAAILVAATRRAGAR